VHHTDAEREWAYDRQSHIGKLDKALDEALQRDWTVVDMKKDWKRIYPSRNSGRARPAKSRPRHPPPDALHLTGRPMSARDQILDLKQRMARSIIGQEAIIERLLIGLLANGNLLVEGCRASRRRGP
jgi:hypothetical protein